MMVYYFSDIWNNKEKVTIVLKKLNPKHNTYNWD